MVRSEAAYLATWALLGIGMRLCLYDAAFAALVQVAPSRGRRAICWLTLFGAFASTVFWVVGHQLNEALGWRSTLAWFAAIQLVVCLPLTWARAGAPRVDAGRCRPDADRGGSRAHRGAAARPATRGSRSRCSRW